MNEPLFTVTELPASLADSSEESKDETPVNPSAPRSRKKGTVELNPPNIHIEPPPPSSKVVLKFKILNCDFPKVLK
jgi:hypothetical protein